MLKRKFGDRPDWSRVTARTYVQSHMEDGSFRGYVTLLRLDRVRQPLTAVYGDCQVVIADDGYVWLQHFPEGEPYSLTTMFDRDGRVMQWYIDMVDRIGVDERGVPWMDDLFLDVIALPSGEAVLKDADELDEALAEGRIEAQAYERVKRQAADVMAAITEGRFALFRHCAAHRDKLLGMAERQA